MWLQSTPSLQACCIHRERAGEPRASQGTRHKGWQRALPFAVPTGGTNSYCDILSPREGQGREKAAISEDVKRDKHFCDPQKQTNHDALVRTTCICLITSCPGPFQGHSGRFFSLALDAGDQAEIFGCPPDIHTQFPPCWTTSLSAVWNCLSHGTWEFFSHKMGAFSASG